MSDHHDSEHGYIHYHLAVENVPGLDEEGLFDQLVNVVHRICDEHTGGYTGEPFSCAFEHFESSSGTKCLFPDDGEPMVRHTAD